MKQKRVQVSMTDHQHDNFERYAAEHGGLSMSAAILALAVKGQQAEEERNVPNQRTYRSAR